MNETIGSIPAWILRSRGVLSRSLRPRTEASVSAGVSGNDRSQPVLPMSRPLATRTSTETSWHLCQILSETQRNGCDITTVSGPILAPSSNPLRANRKWRINSPVSLDKAATPFFVISTA